MTNSDAENLKILVCLRSGRYGRYGRSGQPSLARLVVTAGVQAVDSDHVLQCVARLNNQQVIRNVQRAGAVSVEYTVNFPVENKCFFPSQ